MSTRFIATFAVALLLSQAGGAAAATSQEKAERAASGAVIVTWAAKGPVDIFMAAGPEVPLTAARLVSEADGDGRAEYVPTESGRPYFLLRDRTDGHVSRVAERLVYLEQGSNFRDLGGYAGVGGKHVRWGQIYRSGATPMLTPADVARVKSLGLAELVDLRSSEERVLAPTKVDGVPYAAVGYSMMDMMRGPAAPGESSMGDLYRRMPTLLAPQFKLVFEGLLSGEGPIAYNCSAGQDRTGVASALILSALGVPRDVILADYQLSTTYRRPEFEMPRFDAAAQAANPVAAMFAGYQKDPNYTRPRPLLDSAQTPWLAYALQEIEDKYGSVEKYLLVELGVGPEQVKKLRQMYLE